MIRASRDEHSSEAGDSLHVWYIAGTPHGRGAEPSPCPALSFYLTLYSFPGFADSVLGHTGESSGSCLVCGLGWLASLSSPALSLNSLITVIFSPLPWPEVLLPSCPPTRNQSLLVEILPH